MEEQMKLNIDKYKIQHIQNSSYTTYSDET